MKPKYAKLMPMANILSFINEDLKRYEEGHCHYRFSELASAAYRHAYVGASANLKRHLEQEIHAKVAKVLDHGIGLDKGYKLFAVPVTEVIFTGPLALEKGKSPASVEEARRYIRYFVKYAGIFAGIKENGHLFVAYTFKNGGVGEGILRANAERVEAAIDAGHVSPNTLPDYVQHAIGINSRIKHFPIPPAPALPETTADVIDAEVIHPTEEQAA